MSYLWGLPCGPFDVVRAAPELPNVMKFRSTFSEFDKPTISNTDIDTAIELATSWVDYRRWNVRDWQRGVLYLAAHFLTLKLTQVAMTAAGGVGMTDMYLNRVAFADRSIGFGQRRMSSSESDNTGVGQAMFDMTWYGQVFLMLRDRNVAAVTIV